MGVFTKNLILFAIPLLVLAAVSSALAYQGKDHLFFGKSLRTKIHLLYKDPAKPLIIVAGDSRAERQLIPRIIKEKTGVETINIAVSSGDLVTLEEAIKLFNLTEQKRTFLISTSSFQVNDDAIDPGYISLNIFKHLSLFEKVSLSNSFHEFLIKEKTLAFSYLKLLLGISGRQENDKSKLRYDPKIISDLGFHGVDATLTKRQSLEEVSKNSPWYRGANITGARWRLFVKALKSLSSIKNATFILFQPPVSPWWKSCSSGSYIEKLEVTFAQNAKREAQKYENVYFLDFYQHQPPFLSDDMFYDTAHLNEGGAYEFTKNFMIILSKKKMCP